MPLVLKVHTERRVSQLDKDFEITIVEPDKDPRLVPAPYEGDDDMLKHLQGQHDQRTHGQRLGGAGVDITKKLDKVFYRGTALKDRPFSNKETDAVIREMKDHQIAAGGSYGDNALKIIAERQGFTGKPKTVATVADLQEIQKSEGGMLVYRGIADYAQDVRVDGKWQNGEEVTYTGQQAADDFRHGDYYAGWGMFGNGTYTTQTLDHAVAYADVVDGDNGRKGNGVTMAILIPKTALQAPRTVVRETMKEVAEESSKMWGLSPTHRNDLGRALAAKGYQYYDVGDVQGDKLGNWNILDRSMLTVAEENIK